MGKKKKPEKVLQEWLDRDLTQAALAGELPIAYESDDVIARVSDVISARRHPIVSGEAGIGKSAVIYELVRRASAGQGPEPLLGKQVLQLSLRKRASGLRNKNDMGPAMQDLVEVLLDTQGTVVPFFRDLHLAYDYDLEPQLEMLAMRLGAPILGEGDARPVEAMLEQTPDLEQYYVQLPIEEPDLETTTRILRAWRNAREEGGAIDDRALEETLQLTHRFLSRTRQPRKSLDFVSQLRSLVPAHTEVTCDHVIDRFHRVYRVPRFLIDPSLPFDVDATERQFRQRVLGQDEAVREVVRMISVIKAGLSDTRRPFGAFLFVGPTGVGKTHLAQLLAEFLFGSRDRMVRFNMADYQQAGDAHRLFGNSAAYQLRDRRGLLTMRLMGHPFAVLLLDEFEKAAEEVHDRFLQLVDEGAFINGASETVSCRSMILIATSNAGSEVYRGRSIGFSSAVAGAELAKELERRLLRHFRIEFLNRFDQVVHFQPLGRTEIRSIAMREIEQLRQRGGLKQPGFLLEVDEGLLDWLTAHGYHPLYGARFLRRTIERNVTTALAEAIVREGLAPGSRLKLRVRSGRVVASVISQARRADRVAQVTLPHGTGEKKQVLDRPALLVEARSVVERAGPLLAELEQQREQASEVLSSMNKAGFWDEPDEARAVLERYRDLDVAVQMGDRLSEPIRWLDELTKLVAEQPRRSDELARNLERAARALRHWEEHRAEEGPSAVWLVLRDTDPLGSAADWLDELSSMELAWCRQLGLSASVAAYGHTDGMLARVVLEVEGPGASRFLAMEPGLHRLNRAEGDLRVRIDVVPKGEAPEDDHGPTSMRRREGRFGMSIGCSGQLMLPDRGLVLELQASDRATLAHLLHDLEALAGDTREPELARSYADDGAGARDPRTGAVIPRYRDVIRGKLDSFFEAWRT